MTRPVPSTLAAVPPRLPVAGVAGRIGPHRITYPPQQGCDVDTLDKLSTRHRDAVAGRQFLPGSLAVRDTRDPLFCACALDAVVASQAGCAHEHACRH